jgi:hypothetical protein
MDIGILVHVRVPGQIADAAAMRYSSDVMLRVGYRRTSLWFEPLKREPKFSRLLSQTMDKDVRMIVE